jgi:hypothetical protein
MNTSFNHMINMRKKIIILLAVILISTMLIWNTLTIDVPSKRLSAQTVSSHAKVSNTAGLSKIHGVKIVSPARDQKVPAGKNLTVIGTSIDNATSNCIVSISLNGVKPYQRAAGAGPNGSTDYSLWGFLLTPKYAPIKVGQNQLKAKFSCIDNPSLVSYYSANITGISLPPPKTSTTTAAAAAVNTTTSAPNRLQHFEQKAVK